MSCPSGTRSKEQDRVFSPPNLQTFTLISNQNQTIGKGQRLEDFYSYKCGKDALLMDGNQPLDDDVEMQRSTVLSNDLVVLWAALTQNSDSVRLYRGSMAVNKELSSLPLASDLSRKRAAEDSSLAVDPPEKKGEVSKPPTVKQKPDVPSWLRQRIAVLRKQNPHDHFNMAPFSCNSNRVYFQCHTYDDRLC
jgi:hypothetical protein